jgi:uncharacterized membrane protein
MKEKNLELDRLVFFSDAVVAIAITLLMLELKIHGSSDGHLAFSDLAKSWPQFFSFLLSFFLVSIYWMVHHRFFTYIKEIDIKLLRYNLCWLFFVVLLPFTTSLMSTYFTDVAAMFCYCLNVFFLTLFQNQIWDYVSVKPELLKSKISPTVIFDNRLSCNVAMINALLATVISFFSPLAAIIVLSTRIFAINIARIIFKPKGETVLG